MMNEEEVSFCGDSHADGAEAGIDGCGNAGDFSAVLDLQAIYGTFVVLEFGSLKKFIAS